MSCRLHECPCGFLRPSPAVQGVAADPLRDRLALARLPATGQGTPALPKSWLHFALRRWPSAISQEREIEYRSSRARSYGSHRFAASSLRTGVKRTGSTGSDNRLGVWCEDIGPLREGDKRPASGLDINFARECCIASIECDGVRWISFRRRPLIQPGAGLSHAVDFSRKSETYKDCNWVPKLIPYHRSSSIHATSKRAAHCHVPSSRRALAASFGAGGRPRVRPLGATCLAPATCSSPMFEPLRPIPAQRMFWFADPPAVRARRGRGRIGSVRSPCRLPVPAARALPSSASRRPLPRW